MRSVLTATLGALGVLAGCGAWLALVPPAHTQESPEDPVLVAVETSLDVEQALLDEDREEYSRLARRRATVGSRIAQLRTALDGAVANRDLRAPELIERIGSQLEQAEGERSELQIAERVLVDRIRDRLRRIVLYETRLTELRDREPPEAGLLDGVWDVVLVPIDQRGTFDLRQNGTILTGTYVLSGGFTGSLRGTLVKSKILLERIDSRLGRSMEFEGQLSADLERIRGNWQSYELAEGEGANGQWTATRRGRD